MNLETNLVAYASTSTFQRDSMDIDEAIGQFQHFVAFNKSTTRVLVPLGDHANKLLAQI